MIGTEEACPAALSACLRDDDSGIAITEFGFVAPVFCLMLMGVFDLGFAQYTQSVLQGAVQEGARQASLENTLWTTIEDRVKDQVIAVLPSSDPDTEISFSLDHKSYANYAEVKLPEDFEDLERNKVANGVWDDAEAYVDANGNGQYDPGESFTDRAPYNLVWDPAEPFTDKWPWNGRYDFGEPFADQARGTRNNKYDEDLQDECFVDRNGSGKWEADVGIDNRGQAQDVVSIRAEVSFKRIFPLWAFVGQPQEIKLAATSFLRNQPFGAQPARVGVRLCPAST